MLRGRRDLLVSMPPREFFRNNRHVAGQARNLRDFHAMSMLRDRPATYGICAVEMLRDRPATYGISM